MNPIFQISTRDYDKEIHIIKKALSSLESECGVSNGYTTHEPFSKFGWTFFNVQISQEMLNIIEKTGMMEGALGYRIAEQMMNFLGHYLESKGSNVRIQTIDYG